MFCGSRIVGVGMNILLSLRSYYVVINSKVIILNYQFFSSFVNYIQKGPIQFYALKRYGWQTMFWCFWCKLTLGKTTTRRAVSKYSRSFKLHRQYFILASVSEFSCSWIVRHRIQEKNIFPFTSSTISRCSRAVIMTKKKVKHVQSWCFPHKPMGPLSFNWSLHNQHYY